MNVLGLTKKNIHLLELSSPDYNEKIQFKYQYTSANKCVQNVYKQSLIQ
jgi:hypothetical protein